MREEGVGQGRRCEEFLTSLFPLLLFFQGMFSLPRLLGNCRAASQQSSSRSKMPSWRRYGREWDHSALGATKR